MKPFAVILAFLFLIPCMANRVSADVATQPAPLPAQVKPPPPAPVKTWTYAFSKKAARQRAIRRHRAARRAKTQNGGIGKISILTPPTPATRTPPALPPSAIMPKPQPKPAAVPDKDVPDSADAEKPADDPAVIVDKAPAPESKEEEEPDIYIPPSEPDPDPYAPNRVNRGGIGAVGGLGRIGGK